MHKYSETKTLPHHYKELFDLVLDVEKYPEFLPWVEAVKIISNHDGQMVADMSANFKSIRQNYRSNVTYDIADDKAIIEVNATSGLFKHLYNFWSFTKDGKNTIVQFNIDFEFQSKIIDSLASPLFTSISQKMILAFEKRAMEEYYGNKNS